MRSMDDAKELTPEQIEMGKKVLPDNPHGLLVDLLDKGFLRLGAERLGFLGCVDPMQANFVLHVLPIENRERIAVGDVHDLAGELVKCRARPARPAAWPGNSARMMGQKKGTGPLFAGQQMDLSPFLFENPRHA
jgi:hypothetical protein